MKKSFLRAAMVACLPLCAMGIVVATATPAVAADKDKAPTGPSYSKAIAKEITEAKKASDVKDYKTVIDQCLAARAKPDLTEADKYFIARFLAVAYYNTGEHTKSAAEFLSVVKNPVAPADARQFSLYPAMSLASEANDNATVVELGKLGEAQNILSPESYGVLADAYYRTNDFPNAINYAKKGIEQSQKENKIAPYGLYQIVAYGYDRLKDRPNEIKAFEPMARDFGKPDDWATVLNFSLEFLPAGNKTAREVAALDLYRLRLIVGASWLPQNFSEAGDAAFALKLYGDERTFTEMGVQKGAFPQAKVASNLAINAANIKKDEPVLSQLEKMGKESKGPTTAAESYYGYGRYADAARAAQKAADGGPQVAEAKLVLALSQIKLGDEAAAAKTLTGFSGDPSLVRVAEVINLYLARKYGKTAPAQ